MEFTTPTPEINFGKEIAHAAVESVAIVAGAFVAIVVLSLAVEKIFDLKDAWTIKRQNKK